MPSFAYRVRNERGKLIRGVMDTPDRGSVIEKLQSAGLYVTDVVEIKPGKLNELRDFLRRAKPASLAIFCREFSTMISAGLPLLRAISLLIDHVEDKALQEALSGVRDTVRSGGTLATAFERYPRVFPPLFINSVAAGEAGGTLDVTLKRLALHMERQIELSNRIKSALIYPVILICLAMVILGVVILFVLPRFVPLFLEAGVSLPLPTMLVYRFGMFVQRFIIPIIAWLVVAVVGFAGYIKTEKGRLAFDRFKLNTPLIGKLVKRAEAASFSANLETLIVSGVPILQAMQLLTKIAGNKVVAGLVEDVAESIRSGESVATPLSKSDVFPPMVADMIAVGEETGNLDEMLSKISEFFIEEVQNTAKKLTSILEPILLVFMGSMVIFVALSILLPMFRMIQVIKK